MTTGYITATTWPTYKLGIVGAITKPQLSPESTTDQEPPLGEVFCANLFGHYILLHWLMPLLRACGSTSPAKVIWVSSVEPQHHHFNGSDFQGVLTGAAYEHSKRMTDILSLTANQPSTQNRVSAYTAIAEQSAAFTGSSKGVKRPVNSPPTFHLYHPGVLVTSVIALYWFLQYAQVLANYISRWLGSPWATVEPYTAAQAATWLALTPESSIHEAEIAAFPSSSATVTGVTNGRVKWGTSVDRLGRATARPTEVANWGVNGSGLPYVRDWWGGVHGLGRKPGATEATGEDVQGFVELGGQVWEGMERLRVEWEERLAEAERNGANGNQ